MHETPKRSVEEILESMYEIQMASFVQLSRIYDLLAIGVAKRAEEYEGGIESSILDAHEQGLLWGPEPDLRGFVQHEEDED